MSNKNNFGPMYENRPHRTGIMWIASLFLAVIAAILIIAKLFGWVTLHWVIVLAPIYLPVVGLAAGVLLAILVSLVSDDQMKELEKEMEDHNVPGDCKDCIFYASDGFGKGHCSYYGEPIMSAQDALQANDCKQYEPKHY
jgi:hypothetical protein